jgi:hypothetical protein
MHFNIASGATVSKWQREYDSKDEFMRKQEVENPTVIGKKPKAL